MDITLQCWVNGEDVDRIFPVDISTNKTVGALKKVIREEQFVRFCGVQADSLNLYSIPNDADLTQWRSAVIIKLNARQKVSAYLNSESFVVIEGPSIEPYPTASVPDMTLNCWVLGHDFERVFSVEISSTEVVGKLREAIKNKKPMDFGEVDADALALYKVSLPFDDSIEETLENLRVSREDLLQPLKTLSYYFPGAPLHEHIHLVVDASLPGKSIPPLLAEEDDMLAPLIHSFKIATTITSNSLTPSEAAKSTGYIKVQSGYRRILDCRYAEDKPVNTVAPPIQLFHPAFAFFSSKASDPEYHVPKQTVRDVRALMAQFTQISKKEAPRQRHFREPLAKVIGRPLASMKNSDMTSPDFTVLGNCGTLQTYLVVYEAKNEVGDGGSDPSTQAAFSFQRIFCQDNNAELRRRCCCPAFAIACAGPWVTIMGCIITGNCVVQRLTDFLWVPVHSSHDHSHFIRIARIFYALRESIERLDSWYRDIVKDILPFDESSPHNPHSRFFPSPKAFWDGDTLVRFTYQKPLESDVSCVTYHARTDEENSRDIVIKFVTSYGADVHRYLASAGFAPQLLYYGQIDVEPEMPSYGDLRMVVMEYLDGKTLDKISPVKVPQNFESDLREVFVRLHDADYVFGDLRPPNVMITSKDEVKLIDFDWAGKDDDVEYPVAISSSIPWPQGVQALAPIRKEHDEAMLKRLLDSTTT